MSGQHPFHQWPRVQLGGDGQRFVQQGHGRLPVAGVVVQEQDVSVVTAGPGQLETVAGLTPENTLHYAYAEFLKIDFPRLTLAKNLELFSALALLSG